MGSERRVRLAIVGRVQGVGFRYSARHKARSLDLSGWVRNAEDGSVQADVEGEPANVADFIHWARDGSAPGRVDRVEVLEAAPRGDGGPFEIRG